jgi:hypothetical protein
MAGDGERALAMEEVRNLVVQYPHVVDKGDFEGVGEFYDGVTTRVFDVDGNPTGDDHTTRSSRSTAPVGPTPSTSSRTSRSRSPRTARPRPPGPPSPC